MSSTLEELSDLLASLRDALEVDVSGRPPVKDGDFYRTSFAEVVHRLLAEGTYGKGSAGEFLDLEVKRIRDAMEAQGMSIRTLANLTCVSRTVLNRLFKDPSPKTRIGTIAYAAAAVGVPLLGVATGTPTWRPAAPPSTPAARSPAALFSNHTASTSPGAAEPEAWTPRKQGAAECPQPRAAEPEVRTQWKQGITARSQPVAPNTPRSSGATPRNGYAQNPRHGSRSSPHARPSTEILPEHRQGEAPRTEPKAPTLAELLEEQDAHWKAVLNPQPPPLRNDRFVRNLRVGLVAAAVLLKVGQAAAEAYRERKTK